MVKLYKYFNYISYSNKILLLNKNIFQLNYSFLLLPNSTMKTLRLNYYIKSTSQKYGLKSIFFKHLNNIYLDININKSGIVFMLLYTKNTLRFITFFKKVFSFIFQQENFLFRYPIYVKLTNNIFDYNIFHKFLLSFEITTWASDWADFYNYFFIYLFNEFLIFRKFIFLILNYYFLFWYVLKNIFFLLPLSAK